MVERSPEKAGVGGSIPSLATMFSITYRPPETQFHSISFQNIWPAGMRLMDELVCRDQEVSPHHNPGEARSRQRSPCSPGSLHQEVNRE
jgi:hypothetical protein